MNHVIILAAGQGQRMKTRKDKMLLPICGKPLIYYPIMAFNDHPEIDSITIAVNKFNSSQIKNAAKIFHFPKVKNIVFGGMTRQKSLENGLKALEIFVQKNHKNDKKFLKKITSDKTIPKKSSAKSLSKQDIILVHNGANPLPSHEEISETILLAKKTGACIVGHFINSTVKEVDNKHIIKTHNRKKLFAAQTPQASTYQILKKALAHAKKKSLNKSTRLWQATDEAMLFEAINQKISYIQAHENNFKITTQKDYTALRAILGDLPEDFRIGIGQDSHMFDKGEKGLYLAGIFIKEEWKLKANSDGDVILHAVFNALSQAIGEMSLGFYADEECKKGIKDSKKYIAIILKKIAKQNFKINSLGVMIEAAKPKIDPLVPRMKKSLSSLLSLDSCRIGITATSGENLTAFGEGLGIQCFAIVSLVKT